MATWSTEVHGIHNTQKTFQFARQRTDSEEANGRARQSILGLPINTIRSMAVGRSGVLCCFIASWAGITFFARRPLALLVGNLFILKSSYWFPVHRLRPVPAVSGDIAQ